MKRINCIVQEHQFSSSEIKAIEASFKALYKTHYSDEKLTVLWMIFPKGSAFAERKASNGTIILIEVEDDIDKVKREELMQVYSQFLLENYSISPLDTVITVANTSWVDRFFCSTAKADSSHVSPLDNFKDDIHSHYLKNDPWFSSFENQILIHL